MKRSLKPEPLSADTPFDENRVLMFLGLATRAGKTVSGYDAVSSSVRTGEAYIVLCAQDASEPTAKKVRVLCKEEEIPFRRFSTRESLGKFTGKDDRAVVCIIDKGFADRLVQMLPEDRKTQGNDVTIGRNG